LTARRPRILTVRVQHPDGRPLSDRPPAPRVYCSVCSKLCASIKVAGESRPRWHKDNAGHPCVGRARPGKPSGLPPVPARVQVPAAAWVAALELLEDLRDLAGDRTLPCLCGAGPGCSHRPECVLDRAAAVAAALAGEEAAA